MLVSWVGVQDARVDARDHLGRVRHAAEIGYDQDFRALWRRPDGTRIPLAAKAL